MDRRTNVRTKGRIDSLTDRQADRRTNRETDEQIKGLLIVEEYDMVLQFENTLKINIFVLACLGSLGRTTTNRIVSIYCRNAQCSQSKRFCDETPLM